MAHPGRPKYAPWRAYLMGLSPEVAEVTLSFAELAALLGEPLPGGAWSRQFWANTRAPAGATSQAGAWRSAGWRVRWVRRQGEAAAVTFVRAASA